MHHDAPLPDGPASSRYEPGTPGALDRIATDPAPDTLAAGPTRTASFRDVYFDTVEGDLERRGAWACVRHHGHGVATFAVRTGHEAEYGRIVALDGVEGDPAALFAGNTEPAVLLRAIVDPARLVARVEIETHRRVRPLSSPEGDVAQVAADTMLAREGDRRAQLEEVAILPQAGDPERIASSLRHEYGLRLVAEDRLDRARLALREHELNELETAVRSARRVAVVALDDGRMALRRDRASLRVPSTQGTGEDAARQVLRDCFGQDGARVRLLGTGSGSGASASVEVWLAEGASAPGEEAACEIVHMPLDEILASVGSPALRDRDTLAALHVVARAGLTILAPEGDASDEERRARVTLASAPDPDAEASRLLPVGTLLNMELSILAFNRRVLELAESARVPLLERVRFLGIFGANLDEFFRVRVSGFKRQVAMGSHKRTIDGVTPQDQLDAIGIRARRLMDRAYQLLDETLLPQLGERGVRVVAPGELTPDERAYVRERFERDALPVLMPLTAGPGYPFPHIRNLRPALAGLVRDPRGGEPRLGIVELPDGVNRFIHLPNSRRFVALEEVIREHFPALYPGLEVESPRVFRVTRSAELHLDRKEVEDILHAVEEQVRKRRFRPVVRLEVERGMPGVVRAMLLRELQYEAPSIVSALGEQDVYEVPGLVDLRGIRELADVEAEGLHYPPAPPPRTPLDPRRTVFEQLREREVLVSFPGDSFQATVERLVVDAAEDPDVLAIKLALYRTNTKSRIVEALTRAASAGKQVVALVELTARFDELSNIHWARYLRSFGIHVIYGAPDLKVHAKIALVVRRESDALRQYVYIGTGNLNASTATFYTDLGLMTASPALAAELNEVFNGLTGGAAPADFEHLLVAPYTMRRRFVEMIGREAQHAAAGRRGWIRAKFNGLADREIIAALYQASQAGVEIDLLVRGMCSLRPGVLGLSENIRVYSALGRHLEHSRIFRFENGGEPEYYIGSADWRTRNLSRRVEVAVPIRDPGHRARLDGILDEDLARPDLWELGADGTYYQRPEAAPRQGAPARSGPERRAIITADV